MWANGDKTGLAAFGDDSDVNSTARQWRQRLLEGTASVVPLLAFSGKDEPTRLAALKLLAPRLATLDDGTLHGQGNCFVLLGPRGVGKTRFVKSLVHLVAHVARPTTYVIYVNFKNEGVQEPLKLLQAAFSDRPSAGLELPEKLRRDDASLAELLDFMRENGRRAFVVIDEVEEAYKKDSVLTERVYRQLHTMGEFDGAERPVVTLITGGSPAVLEPLVFSKPGCDISREEYPCYLRFSSLNDRKYVPISLRPLVHADDVRP
jgi:AAA domain